MEKILIEVTAFGIRHSSVLKSDATAEEFIENCCSMAEAIGFNPKLVREALRIIEEKFE